VVFCNAVLAQSEKMEADESCFQVIFSVIADPVIAALVCAVEAGECVL